MPYHLINQLKNWYFLSLPCCHCLYRKIGISWLFSPLPCPGWSSLIQWLYFKLKIIRIQICGSMFVPKPSINTCFPLESQLFSNASGFSFSAILTILYNFMLFVLWYQNYNSLEIWYTNHKIGICWAFLVALDCTGKLESLVSIPLPWVL